MHPVQDPSPNVLLTTQEEPSVSSSALPENPSIDSSPPPASPTPSTATIHPNLALIFAAAAQTASESQPSELPAAQIPNSSPGPPSTSAPTSVSSGLTAVANGPLTPGVPAPSPEGSSQGTTSVQSPSYCRRCRRGLSTPEELREVSGSSFIVAHY